MLIIFLLLLVCALARPQRLRAGKYPVLQCGEVVLHNTTWIEADVNDYYAVVNASAFTVVTTDLGVDPSSPACDPSVDMNFGPDGPGDYPVFIRSFSDGASFNFSVGPVQPPVAEYDLFFSSEEICDYTISLRRLEIVC